LDIGITPEQYGRMTMNQIFGISRGLEIRGIKAKYNADEGVSVRGAGVKYEHKKVKK